MSDLSSLASNILSLGITVGNEAATQKAQPTMADKAQTVASVGIAAAPVVADLASASPATVAKVGFLGKAMSFFGALQGVKDAVDHGSKLFDAIGRTGADASEAAHAKAWDDAIAAGKTLDEAASLAGRARTDLFESAHSDIRAEGSATFEGAWTAAYNTADLVSVVPVGTGSNLVGNLLLTSVRDFNALPGDVQGQRLQTFFAEEVLALPY